MKYTTKEDLGKKIFGLGQYVPGMPHIRDLALRITSGTTGMPSLVVNRRANNASKQELITTHARCLLALVPKRASYYKWTNDFLRDVTGQPLECFIPADMGDMKSGSFNASLKDTHPDAVMSFPTSYILEGLKYIDDEVRDQLAQEVRHVVIGGEMLSPVEMHTLQNAFPRAEIYNTYGLAEADLFTAACPALIKRYEREAYAAVHPFDEDYALSIAEPDDEGFGEIVVTTHELTNYRTGDVGALRDEQCPCGARHTLLVAGRKDFDRVSVFGAFFHAKILMNRMDTFTDFLADYLLEVKAGSDEKGERRGSVTLFVVPKASPLPSLMRERLLTTLHELPVSKTRLLGLFVKEGLFAEPVVREVPMIERSGTKRIHLRRIFS